jgi:hypothetical protein
VHFLGFAVDEGKLLSMGAISLVHCRKVNKASLTLPNKITATNATPNQKQAPMMGSASPVLVPVKRS